MFVAVLMDDVDAAALFEDVKRDKMTILVGADDRADELPL